MITLIIIFVMLAIVLAIALAVSICKSGSRFQNEYQDKEYINEEGDHTYYERSLIEKKEYARRHPNIKDIRRFSRLFRKG
ncbi:MAG: hypothetical protein K2G13_01550 [Muribaculaceae bacterium]|nr:hypothetical protein [Muribaculaceae bacterium]